MRTYIVDAFTSAPFKGNPAGVCIVGDQCLSEKKMLSIAKELNLSETAFVTSDNDDYYGIRYFSPKKEIPLCGHATLASAKVLFSQQENGQEKQCISFSTHNNVRLEVKTHQDTLHMMFPHYLLSEASAPESVITALGVSDVVAVLYNQETNILMIEIESAEQLQTLTPDFEALIRSHSTINGVLVTAQGQNGYDFYSRYFWPWSGTNEDPVTGATHTFMAPYWAKKLGKNTLKSFQCSERTGYMTLELQDEGLVIQGEAVIVFEGKLCV
ncbi:MAG: PhzF family phenazine biosynthesis protein [Agarilytica sp.]